MAELHVRNMSVELHERLRERAAGEGRSMSAEAIVLLRQALEPTGGGPARPTGAIARLREIQARTRLPAGASPAEQLVRDDRNAAG